MQRLIINHLLFKRSVFLLILLPLLIHAQYEDIRFETIKNYEQLSGYYTYTIIQDKKGFMWFGTNNGLNRYDGYNFTTYLSDSDNPFSINNNVITALYEDKQGYLWIGTAGGGLNRFDPLTEKFMRYLHDKGKSTSLSDNTVISKGIFEDHDGNIWISTFKGLSRLEFSAQRDDSAEISFKNYYFPSYGKKNIVTAFYDDGAQIWLGTNDGSLCQFNSVTGKMETVVSGKDLKRLWNVNADRYMSDNTFFIGHNPADATHILTIGTGIGLYKYNTLTNKITHLYDLFRRQYKEKVWNLREMFIDENGSIWITSRNGLYFIDARDKNIVYHQWTENNRYGIGWKYISDIYQDGNGIVWIGFSGKKSIQKYIKRKQQFEKIKVEYKQNYFSIWSVLEDKEDENIIWFGTLQEGFFRYDRKNRKIKHYDFIAKRIWQICQSPLNKNILWIGTDDGLFRFDKKTEQLTRPEFTINDISRVNYNDIIPENTKINTLYFDSQQTLWIGTYIGLYRYNPQTKSVRIYRNDPADPNSIAANRITFITEIKRKKQSFLFVGSSAGLSIYDYESDLFRSFKNDLSDTSSINNNTVNCVHQDKNGAIWIGTESGLARFDPETGRFHRIVDENKFLVTLVTNILSDNAGHLWIRSINDFFKLNPLTKKIRIYDEAFNALAYHRSPNKIIYGNYNILTIFNPDSIKDNPNLPRIYLTDFRIFNKPVKPGTQDSPLIKAIAETKEIVLNFDQSVFSFEFAALEYSNPSQNKYAYKMAGIDPDWVYTDASRRFATYTNLDPGEYTFRVKGSNDDGLWNEAGTSIKVIILPPWWQTQLAYIFYFVFFIGIIVTTWRFQLRRLHIKHQLQMEHFEAEKWRELDQMKSHFFANISHEFRTPLTLIKGPVQQIMNSNIAGHLKDKCKVALRNSDRLLGLINQILDLSRLESGTLKLQVSETEIIPYLKGLVLSFSSLAERKRIVLKFNGPGNSLSGFIDRDKLQKIVSNLLSNAFKFTPEGGAVEVLIKYPPQSQPAGRFASWRDPLPRGEESISPLEKGDKGGCIQIAVANTGPGIPEEQLDKIFNRFYQTDSTHYKDIQGSGIGLALTKELVEVCHGAIKVSSVSDKKTIFEVILPVTRDSFYEDEIVEKTENAERITENEKAHSDSAHNFEEKKSFPVNKSCLPSPVFPSPRILIVEDNPDVTKYICDFMYDDYNLITAENGKTGFKEALNKDPDLIISDVMMPEMDGFELCKKIKSDIRTSHIPVILLTARADLDSKIEGLQFGADDYISKPFEAAELKVRARNLIEQRKKLREKFSRLIDIQPGQVTASSMDEQLLHKMMAVCEKHISESGYSTEHFARDVGLSKTHLNRKLRALTNLSAHGFILNLRLKRATQLLQKNAATVSEIAYSVGFENPSQFAKAFRRQYGTSPKAFIDKN